MPADEIIGPVIGFAIGVAKGFLKDLIFDKVCYTLGWIVLRVLTFGRHPNEPLSLGLNEDEGETFWTSTTGGLALVAIAMRLWL